MISTSIENESTTDDHDAKSTIASVNNTKSPNEINSTTQEDSEIMKEIDAKWTKLNLMPNKLNDLITLDTNIIFTAVQAYNSMSNKTNESGQDLLSAPVNNSPEEDKIKYWKSCKVFMLTDPYTDWEELYFCNNYISRISCLDHLSNLQVWNLNSNNIASIENIKHWDKLQILDLAGNNIADFRPEELPRNWLYLYLYFNPLYDKVESVWEVRSMIIIHCDKIERIDKWEVKEWERWILIEGTNKQNILRGSKRWAYIISYYKELYDECIKQREIHSDKFDKEMQKIKDAKWGNKITNNTDEKGGEDTMDGMTSISVNNKLTTSHSIVKHIEEDLNRQTVEKINNLQVQAKELFSSSIWELQAKSEGYSQNHDKLKKSFWESEEVKLLRAKTKELTEKFKNTKFPNEQLKESFRQRMLAAIGANEKIINAEDRYKEVVARWQASTRKEVGLSTIIEETVKKSSDPPNVGTGVNKDNIAKEINSCDWKANEKDKETHSVLDNSLLTHTNWDED